VLASLPDSNKVFPLLGRPQDSLDDKDEEYVLPDSYVADKVRNSLPKYNSQKYPRSSTTATYAARKPRNPP
jgi:hypothetical protein